MQLMPETAKELKVSDPFNPYENILAGSTYLKKMLETFSDFDKAIAAYNAGPNNVKKYKGIPPFKETQDFVKRVKAYYSLYKQQAW